MKKVVGVILLVLAIAMLYLGIKGQMLPPALTGIGFLAISFLYLKGESQ